MSNSSTIQNSDGETFVEVIDVIGVSEVKKAFQQSVKEGSLHKWFKGSKSKDGKPGWVNVVTGGTCASDEKGEGTPKCVSSSKRASMSKSERLSASRRKKKADPGQQGKSGAAKPTYVSTDKKKKMSEDVKRDEYGDPIGGPKISKKQLKKNLSTYEGDKKIVRSEEVLPEGKDKKSKGSGTKDACYHKVKSRYSVWPSAYASGALVKCRKKGAANWGNKSESYEINPVAHKAAQKKSKIRNLAIGNTNPNEKAAAEKKAGGPKLVGEGNADMKNYLDKKAKKLEKQRDSQSQAARNNPHFDSTQPSPSGRNKYEGYIPEEGYDVARDQGKVRPSKDKKDATTMPPSKEMMKTQKINKGPSAAELVKKRYGKSVMDMKKEEVELDEKCWKGYKKKGMKTMFGKRYPNCVKAEFSDWRDELEQIDEAAGKVVTVGLKGAIAGGKQIAKNISKKTVRAGIKVGGKQGGKAVKKAGKVAATETKKAAGEVAVAAGQGVSKGLKKRKERTLDKIKRKSEQMVSGETRNENFVQDNLDKIQKGAVDTAQKSGAAMSKELVKGGAKVAGIGAAAYLGSKLIGKGIDRVLPDKKKLQKQKVVKENKSPAWQRKAGKSESGGLNKKGVASYRAANPGSKLKTAVTTKPSKLKKGSKAANRRKSFCSRMKGMKAKLTSAKTARDPDSRINKSLRKWNC